MADFTADFEAGVDTATITTGGGEASATAWNAVNGTPTYSSAQVAHGSLSALIAADGDYMQWTLPDPTDHYGRAYFYGDSPGTVFLHKGLNTADNAYYEILLFGSQIYIRDTGQVHQFGTTATVPNNTWWRIEWHIVNSLTVGEMYLRYFDTADATSPTETLSSSANCNTGEHTHTFVIGSVAGTWGSGFYVDDIVANATDWVGPVPATPQTLLASADSVDGAWTDQAGGTSLAAAIDEATFDDADYIRSELNPSASGCRVKLSAGGDPHVSTDHVIHWRTGKIGSATINMTVKLYQGGGNSQGAGTLIATFDRDNVGALTTYTETMSGGEADSITDYTDLYLEFFADTA